MYIFLIHGIKSKQITATPLILSEVRILPELCIINSNMENFSIYQWIQSSYKFPVLIRCHSFHNYPCIGPCLHYRRSRPPVRICHHTYKDIIKIDSDNIGRPFIFSRGQGAHVCPRHGVVALKNYKDTAMDWSQISYTGKVEKVQTQPDTGHTQVG